MMPAKTMVAVFIAVTWSSSLAAQTTLRGRVIDSEMGTALAGALVQVGQDTAGPTMASDSAGFFAVSGLSRGMLDLRIRMLGYEERAFQVFIPDSGELYRQFALDFNGFMLPEIIVLARAERLQPRYIDFERRRARKLGAFFRWDDIKKASYNTVGDALRTVRGVRIQCDQSRFECFAVMSRSPNCLPTWYIDGIEVHSFQENTSIRDVYGIEVYRGTGEIPAEYAGSTAGCGVIAMWTKSRPYR
jgi:hypothetical protein